jgi:outer membrane receptor protein involved in Fe transport
VRLLGEKGFNKNTSWQNSVTVDYEISDSLSLTWINGYNHTRFEEKGDFGFSDESFNPFSLHVFDAPFGPPPAPFTAAVVIAGPVVDFAADLSGISRDYSSEMRLAYEGNGWNLLLGSYFFDSKRAEQSNRVAPQGFAAILSEAYFGERDRMVAVCTANVAAFSGPCTTEVFNLALGPGAFPDFAFAGNTTGLAALTLNANRDLIVEKISNLAAFGMISRDFTDQLTLSFEARVASEKITSNTTEGTDSYDFLGNLTSSTFTATPERRNTFSNFNSRFTASYAVSDTSNLYAVAARGTKPGGFNDTEVIPLGLGSFLQEKVWSFELGSKNVFMDGNLVLNLAAFHNTINDYQLTEAVVIPALNETTSIVSNKGKVRVQGVEIEAVFAPRGIAGLFFNANYAYTDSEFLEGTDEVEGQLQDVLADQSMDCDPCSGSIVGRQLPRQAKHMYNFGANYTRALGENWSVVLNANLSHESKKFVQVHNLAWVGSTTLVSASIGFESESLRIVFWGKNLTNEDAVVSASRFVDEGTSFQRIFMGNPRIGRQFGATASYRF